VPPGVEAAEDAAALDDESREAGASEWVAVAAHPLLAGRRPGRALASHASLAWRGVSSTGAAATCQILESLLVEHGPPLVLKSDHGSAFVSASMSQLLSRWGVTPLFSPTRRPRYNGALERANSTHKTYTHNHAVTAGHPYFWTSADLEQARRVANRITRPWGHTGPSPDEAWRDRSPITADERDRFIREWPSRRPSRAASWGWARATSPPPKSTSAWRGGRSAARSSHWDISRSTR